LNSIGAPRRLAIANQLGIVHHKTGRNGAHQSLATASASTIGVPTNVTPIGHGTISNGSNYSPQSTPLSLPLVLGNGAAHFTTNVGQSATAPSSRVRAYQVRSGSIGSSNNGMTGVQHPASPATTAGTTSLMVTIASPANTTTGLASPTPPLAPVSSPLNITQPFALDNNGSIPRAPSPHTLERMTPTAVTTIVNGDGTKVRGSTSLPPTGISDLQHCLRFEKDEVLRYKHLRQHQRIFPI
jgi:hypothetical protein